MKQARRACGGANRQEGEKPWRRSVAGTWQTRRKFVDSARLERRRERNSGKAPCEARAPRASVRGVTRRAWAVTPWRGCNSESASASGFGRTRPALSGRPRGPAGRIDGSEVTPPIPTIGGGPCKDEEGARNPWRATEGARKSAEREHDPTRGGAGTRRRGPAATYDSEPSAERHEATRLLPSPILHRLPRRGRGRP
jgi:hypothetical protein